MKSYDKMLTDYVVENSSKYIKYLHPDSDILTKAKSNTHYLINSKDTYLNTICIQTIIENCYNENNTNDIKYKYKPVSKESADINFKSMDNIIDIDCSLIQRKSRNTIHEFISKFAKRQAINQSKHIIVVRNFEHILLKFQQIYKSLMDKYYSNTCFIISTTQYNLVHEYVKNITTFIRIPIPTKKTMINFLNHLCDDKQIDGININQIVDKCSNDIYTCVSEVEYVSNSGETESEFVDLFTKNIEDLFEKLKKSKSFDKAIDSIRNHINKILHYSLQDNYIFNLIYEVSLKYKKLNKNQDKLLPIIAKQNELSLYSSKKIFLYERIFIEVFKIFHNI